MDEGRRGEEREDEKFFGGDLLQRRAEVGSLVGVHLGQGRCMFILVIDVPPGVSWGNGSAERNFDDLVKKNGMIKSKNPCLSRRKRSG
jgi:hypothetical protein